MSEAFAQGAPDALKSTALPVDERFLDVVAECLFDSCVDLVATGDLSSVRVLVPALPIAAELRAAMLRGAPRPLLLPQFDTLSHWVESADLGAIPDPMPASERLVLLHEALRSRDWFDESALWGIATEAAELFDELTAAAVSLPDDVAELQVQLQNAYALRGSEALAFEARVVHELWRALALAGQVDAAAAYRLRLAALARRAAALGAGALLVLLDAAPDEALDAAERDFLRQYGQRHPVSIFYPAPREARALPLPSLLDEAWPFSPEIPLFERAQDLARLYPESPLGSEGSARLQLVPANGREHEARAVVAQVGVWVSAGLRRIALIAQDRLTARRVRALLERENVLVNDETGWKLSTSRAAAAVDALIETVAGGAYYRDVLDLCKSPFVFSDCAESERKAAIYVLEAAVRASSVKGGLPRIRLGLLAADDSEPKALALSLLDRVSAAATLLRAKPASLARWIGRLHKALEALGAHEPLRGDAAGKVLLELLATRQLELEASAAQFNLASWRDWLNREFESANFRDGGISSSIVLTPLNAVCLRRFEAAVLIGGDDRQLAPAATGEFFNQSVRRELGLRTRIEAERELRRDLELLFATVPRVTVTWQSVQDGEANLLAPELALLSTLHRLAWGDDLRRLPLPPRSESYPAGDTAPGATERAAPVVPSALIPEKISVSGYASLVACPYRFFARHVLRLGEMDEVSEEMEKSDYGALVHRVLERFHASVPRVSALGDDEALAVLRACVSEVFDPAIADDFLANGWRLRWEKRLPAYLDWQRQVEAEGWRWAQAETKVSRVLSLDNDRRVELYGRIDRIDHIGQGEASVSLLDYKTQTATAIRSRLKDDIQLPAYALLHGDAAKAAYVALDDERIVAVSSGDEEHPLMVDAEAQAQRLSRAFTAMHAGTSLPAHGVDGVCQWCEMSGLCRRDYV